MVRNKKGHKEEKKGYKEVWQKKVLHGRREKKVLEEEGKSVSEWKKKSVRMTVNKRVCLLMCINVMKPFSLRDSNQRTACARSVRVNPHVCCQVYKVRVSVSNIVSNATGSRVHTTSIHKNPPSVSCHVPRCLNTVPTHFTHDQTQRVATKPDFHQHPSRRWWLQRFPSQRNVLSPLTLIPGAQRIKTMLTCVTRDQSSRRRELKVASHKPEPYEAWIPKLSVPQRKSSYPLFSRCSILSVF